MKPVIMGTFRDSHDDRLAANRHVMQCRSDYHIMQMV